MRTIFLLRYCADPDLPARITGQLNKGETLHALRRPLVIGSRAQLRADEDDRRRHALCLQLLVNAVLVWNTRYRIDDPHAPPPLHHPADGDEHHSRPSSPIGVSGDRH